MKFNQLTKTKFIKRPNRFILLLEIEDTKERIEAHLPDPGRLKELLVKGAVIWVEKAAPGLRKTKWTAILCETNTGVHVSLKTTIANKLVEEALIENKLAGFLEWEFVRREYTVGHSRFDFLLLLENRRLLLEVKSVTLSRNNKGYFPDAVTQRGARHVQELTQLAFDARYEAAILFVAQREDIESIQMEDTIDPRFSTAMKEAQEAGVLIKSIGTTINQYEILIERQIPVFI